MGLSQAYDVLARKQALQGEVPEPSDIFLQPHNPGGVVAVAARLALAASVSQAAAELKAYPEPSYDDRDGNIILGYN